MRPIAHSKDVTGKTRATIDFDDMHGGSFPVTLTAESGQSKVTKTVIATPSGYPAPSAPRLKPGTSPERRSFEIAWDFSPEENAHVLEFEIRSRDLTLFGVALPGERDKLIESRSTREGSVTIEPGKSYELTVIAVYDNGTKSPVVAEREYGLFRTAGYVPPANLTVTEVQSGQAMVSWQHNDPLGGVDFFRIRVTKDDLAVVAPENATWIVTNDQVNKGLTWKTVDGLDPSTRYYVQVRAVYQTVEPTGEFVATDAEYGPFTTRPPAITGLQVTARRRKQLDIVWEDASWADSLRLEWTGAGVTKSANPARTATTYTIDQLEADTAYAIKLVATQANQTGEATVTESTLPYVAPTAPTFTHEGPREVTVNWTHLDPGGDPDGFAIFLDGVKVEEVGADKKLCPVTGLSPGRTYTFHIRAKYALEFIDGPAASFTTNNVAMTGVGTTAVRRQQIDVVWDPAADWANWTKVQWRKSGSATWSGSGELGGGSTSYTITGLDHATTYEIKVSAAGGGVEREAPITRTTADFLAPSKPTFSGTSQTQVTVNWTHNDPAGAADGFAIFRGGLKIDEVGAAARSYTSTGLDPGTAYSFFVRALYLTGSQDSQAASVTTSLPNAPTLLTPGAADVTRHMIAIQWTNVGWATSYRVSWTGGSTTLGANASSYEITGLNPNTTYSIQVTALKGSVSTSSNTISVRTDSFIAPASVTAVTVKRQEFTISWAHDDPNGGVEYFQIVRFEADGVTQKTILKTTSGPSARQTTVTGLNPNTTYYIRVRAYYSASDKYDSALIVIKTNP